jgi:hypothetical protein
MVLHRVCSLLRTQAKSAVEDKGQRYCVCLGPNDGRWMIGCDECEDWFHGGYVLYILFFVYCIVYTVCCIDVQSTLYDAMLLYFGSAALYCVRCTMRWVYANKSTLQRYRVAAVY